MQMVAFASILLTTAYAPEALLSDWLWTIAELNPITYVLEGVRQAYVSPVGLERTWHAYLALALVLGLFGTGAVKLMQRVGR
jgi:ABC-type polysaccharide/polyol phosphate export permease